VTQAEPGVEDSPYAWMRLGLALVLGTIGGVGMWSAVVVLPSIEKEFGLDRAAATLPFTVVTIGFALGGVLMGRLADRFGVAVPVALGGVFLGIGYVIAGMAPNLWVFAAAHAVPIGLLGSSAVFGPLMADSSRWFIRNRGIAVAISAAGNYLAAAIWPPVVQLMIDTIGWRMGHVIIGVVCAGVLVPMSLLVRRRPPAHAPVVAGVAEGVMLRGISHQRLMVLLCVAGVMCCVAMSMPQVHIVAYCGDLGYGVARGAEMLTLMFGFGVISRLATGWIADRIGGLWTLLLGSVLQGFALVLYFIFDGLTSLYVVSALFGLFQGGIIPSYAIIVREYFPAREAGTRVGIVLMMTILGMALGGWMSGAIFDLTGSYRAAFANGVAWNLVNLAIAVLLLVRSRPASPKPVMGVA
jgi:MFS family permease